MKSKFIKKWGMNFKKVYCPKCGLKQAYWRWPQSLNEALWGGGTCPECGCKMDKWGKEKPK